MSPGAKAPPPLPRPRPPLGPLQVVVGLLQLPDVFVQLILDAAGLAQVVLQHRDLLVALRVLLLQFVLSERGDTGDAQGSWISARPIGGTQGGAIGRPCGATLSQLLFLAATSAIL